MMGESFIFQSTFKNTQRRLCFFLVFIIVAMYSYFTIVVK